MGTVTDKGSAYGSTTTARPNRLLKDDRTNSENSEQPVKDLKMIINKLRMVNFSFQVTLKELLNHLVWLSFFILKWGLIGTCLVSFVLVGACREPGVKLANGYRVPDIDECSIRVNLSGRGLQELHFEGNYDDLRELNVSNNYIQYILRQVFHGMTLDHLDLSRNSLSVIREDSFNGSSISWIDLSGNQIQIIFEGAFEGLQGSLTFLNLAHNNLRELTNGALSNLQGVTYIDISYNHLTNIDPDAFKGMDGILVLKLQSNQLTSVIGWLPPVGGQLDLSGNSLTTTEGLPQNADSGLDVSHNQFLCSKETKEFHEWCSQTENCHGLNNLEDICYYDVDSDTSKGESPPTTDHNIGSGGKHLHAYVILCVGLPLLVGICLAF